MHDAAMAVGDDLKFNVMGIMDELFQIDLFVSKCFLRLVTRTVKGRFKTGLVMCCAHAAPAAAGSRLDHHRVTNLLRDPNRFILCLDDSIASRRHRHAGFPCKSASSIFISHCLHRARRWPDKLNVAAFAHLGEMRVLGQKSIPGMDRIDVANLGCAHDPIDF